MFSMIPDNKRCVKYFAIFSALTVVAAVAYLPGLGYLELYLEEPRRALIAANMLTQGDYWVPIHAGEFYLGKPPLFNWLIALISLPIGHVNEITARLPSVFALWLFTLFFIATNNKRLGVTGAVLFGCVLLLSPEFLLKGQLAEIDVVFACFVAAALWSWFLHDEAGRRGFSLWFFPLLLISLAYLTKREPAFVFFYLTVITYLFLHDRWRELFTLGHALAFTLVLIPILIWILMLINRVGYEAVWQSLLHEVLLRGEGRGLERYVRHLITYPWAVLGANLPFSLLLLPLINNFMRQQVLIQHSPVVRFCSVAILVNLPLYWLKGDVAIRYFLPMFPFIALLAMLIYTTLRTVPNALWPRYLSRLSSILRWLIPLLTFLLAATVFQPHFIPKYPMPLPIWFTLMVVIFVDFSAWLLRQYPNTWLLLARMVLLMLLLRFLEFNIYLPLKAQELAQQQNAPAIIADLKTRCVDTPFLYVTLRIPSAIWFYAPPNFLQLIHSNTHLPAGTWLLRHKAQPVLPLMTPEFTWVIRQIYQYENDILYLEQSVKL